MGDARTSQKLRATSDQLIIAIAETDARERRKRAVVPTDRTFVELAKEVRLAAEVVLELARQEEATARETASAPESVGLPPIEQTSPTKELAGILERWRAVEQRLKSATPGSADAEALMLEFEQLRARYADALKARQKER